ncbi:hypothetical protein OTU49_004675 [Cherax quadricarinatus]|uniref:Fibronectin type-III domain-containing protein n=1 Tax=Cherax quadricarinatus TaxID=27406 RepID=A0AAW0XAS6_CHEQU
MEPVERNLETLQLDGNPLICGCGVKELWMWLQDHLSYVPDPTALTCSLPKVLSGLSFLLLSSSAFCPQPLIVRLSVQDIQSHSLLVSWQATNTSTIYGFKVSFRETTSDGRVIGGLKTQSLPATPKTHLLKGLRPSTDYLVCVEGLAAAPAPATSSTTQGHTPPHQQGLHQNNGLYLNQPDMASKCLRVKTQEPPPPEIVLNNRLAIMIGASLGITIFLVAGAVICCCQMCKDKREAAKREAPPSQDYLSYRQFSVQGQEANAVEEHTEC